MKFRLLIVDDEPLIRSGIRAGLSRREDVEVAGEAGSVAEAVDALRTGQVDLLLLDVELPDGTGFDGIRRFGPDRMPVVVFVTAYDRYAIQAFEVNAVRLPAKAVRSKPVVGEYRSRSRPPVRLRSDTGAKAGRSDSGSGDSAAADARRQKRRSFRPGVDRFGGLD